MLCYEIIADLSEIIESQKNNIVNTIFSFVKLKFLNNEIILEENPDVNPEINQKMATSIFGIFFRKDNNEHLCLSFGKKYLDTYNKNSSMHYVMLIHELKHVYDYYQNKDTFFDSSEKERFLYEIDAKKVEYEFIKKFLVGKYQLSNLEKLIINNYENDNLESYNIIMSKQSIRMFKFITDLETAYKNKVISEQILFEKLTFQIDELLKYSDTFLTLITAYQQDGKNITYYADFIKLKTLTKYFYLLIVPLLNNIPVELKERLGNIDILIKRHDHPNDLYSLALDNYYENEFITQNLNK